MAIIKQYHKDTNTTYVYESISYWDAEKQQSRSKRKLLGKLDPDTGGVIPTGSRGRKKKASVSGENGDLHPSVLADCEKNIRELTLLLGQRDARLAALEQENRKLRDTVIKIQKSLNQCADICASVSE